jgi:hypothetical protein
MEAVFTNTGQYKISLTDYNVGELNLISLESAQCYNKGDVMQDLYIMLSCYAPYIMNIYN